MKTMVVASLLTIFLASVAHAGGVRDDGKQAASVSPAASSSADAAFFASNPDCSHFGTAGKDNDMWLYILIGVCVVLVLILIL